MSFLLFDYTGSAMKNHVYSSRRRLAVSQEPDLLSEKTKSSRTSNSHGLFSFLRFCTRVSLVCFVPLNKNEQSSFSEYVNPKLFLTFLLISTDSKKKKQFPQTISKVLIRRTCKISEKINNLCLSWSS